MHGAKESQICASPVAIANQDGCGGVTVRAIRSDYARRLLSLSLRPTDSCRLKPK